MLEWASRAALDNIGIGITLDAAGMSISSHHRVASLGYNFGALDGKSSEMADLIRRSL